MLEFDFELVPFDRGDRAVAELAVEHALAERQIVPAFVAETYCRGAGFNHSLRFWIEMSAAARALPAWTARRSTHRLRGPKMGERIGTLRPLGAPQTLAASHGRFFVDVGLWQ